MKKVLSLLLAVCLIAACLPLGAAAAGFTDLNPKEWYYPAASYCLEKGLMSGVGTGKFDPNGVVSRAQITQVLYNREGKPAPGGANKFTDVKAGEWYADGIAWCNAKGIVNGESATTFAPNKPVSREQLCTMLYNYYTKHLGLKPAQASEEEMAVYTDYKKVSSWAKDAIRWAVKSNVMKGKTTSTLAPTGEAIRVELAQFLLNFDTVLGGEQPEPTAKPTVEPTSTPAPTLEPSATPEPTQEPTPTPAPTVEPTASPGPTVEPTQAPPTTPPEDLFPLSIQRTPILAGQFQSYAINPDGTVNAVGKNEMGGLNIQDWTDIAALACERNATLGLKNDGTVVGTSVIRQHYQAEIDALRDVVSIDMEGGLRNSYIAALHSDGTVTFIDADNGSRKLDWTNIVQISAGSGNLFGLKADGTVVTYGDGYNLYGALDVGDWTDIQSISAGTFNTVGVKRDGSVVAAGEEYGGKIDVGGWTDIVAAECGSTFTIGLRSDGTVVGAGFGPFDQMDKAEWHDIAAISLDNAHVVALRTDGTVLAVGSNGNGQCEVSGWTAIPDK